jgi:hypothetical protein
LCKLLSHFYFATAPFLLYKPENHCTGYRDCATNFYEIICSYYMYSINVTGYRAAEDDELGTDSKLPTVEIVLK